MKINCSFSQLSQGTSDFSFEIIWITVKLCLLSLAAGNDFLLQVFVVTESDVKNRNGQ